MNFSILIFNNQINNQTRQNRYKFLTELLNNGMNYQKSNISKDSQQFQDPN